MFDREPAGRRKEGDMERVSNQEEKLPNMTTLQEARVDDPGVEALILRLKEFGGFVQYSELVQSTIEAGQSKQDLIAAIERGMATGRLAARNMLNEFYVVDED